MCWVQGDAFAAMKAIVAQDSLELVGLHSHIGSQIFDSLYSTAGTEASYATFATNLETRLNVVYVGGNDGYLHGFRSGASNADGTYNSTLNDGKEVVGFMPSTALANSNIVSLTSTAYSHDYFADSTPGYGDLYFNGAWHSWLVSGIGPGGPTGPDGPRRRLSAAGRG